MSCAFIALETFLERTRKIKISLFEEVYLKQFRGREDIRLKAFVLVFGRRFIEDILLKADVFVVFLQLGIFKAILEICQQEYSRKGLLRFESLTCNVIIKFQIIDAVMEILSSDVEVNR